MPDTITAPATPGPSGAPASSEPTAPQTVTEASQALRSAATWEAAGFAGMGVTDGTDEGTEGQPEAAAATAETPAGGEAPADGPEFVQDANGAWHRADGTMASADEIAAITAQEAAEAKAPEAAKPEDAPTATTVKLRTRDGSEREVQVDDPELAQLIQQNFNDGMRRKEYTQRVADVESKLAHLNQVEATLQESPETFVYHSLSDEQRINLGVMLLARDFDRLIPAINTFNSEPGARIEETAKATARVKEAEGKLAQMAEARNRSTEVRRAVETLIPEHASEADVSEFMTFASTLLTNAINSGQVVNATTAPQLVSGLAARYGFSQAAATPAAPAKPRITAVATPNASTPPVAQPANDAAKALAEAKAAQKRIRLTQANRANAAAVPPAGAGAAPVRLPPVPKGATIEEASKNLRQQRSWTS